jgi:hypothetical protein
MVIRKVILGKRGKDSPLVIWLDFTPQPILAGKHVVDYYQIGQRKYLPGLI